jgi:hypothetical protein
VFTEPGGLAYSSDSMPVWFSFDGQGPGAIHHPFFGRAEKIDSRQPAAASPS